MPPAADPAAPVPHVSVPAELLAALRLAVAEVVGQAKPLLIDQSDVPAFLGVSRSCWFRWRAEGIAPKPVAVSGGGVKFRRADLERFVEKLKTA